MTDTQRDAVLQSLRPIVDPDTRRSIVDGGTVRELRVENGEVRFLLALQRTGTPEAKAVLAAAEKAAMSVEGTASVHVRLVNAAPPAEGGLPPKQAIPGVRHVVAVSSGKGGVGKSTVCVNLALAAAKEGLRVGILDGDVYGPNIPLMLGAKGRPSGDAERLHPFESHGIQTMSMGLLVGDDQPMVWRGPMLNKAVTQFMFQVAWNDLDILFVDMPPGTGDVQLTLTQNTNLSGAVLVTTPQKVSVLDVKKAVRMFEKMDTPVLGVVENMSWFQPPGSSDRFALFGEGGGREIEKQFKIPLLGQIPIGISVREGGDNGKPVVVADPDSDAADAFVRTARRTIERIRELATAPQPQ